MKGRTARVAADIAAAAAVVAATLTATVATTAPTPAYAESGPLCNNVVAVAAGHSHALAIRSDGAVYGWGNNTRGQLGLSGPGVDRTAPVTIDSLRFATSIAAGYHFTVARFPNGTVRAAGLNAHGQVGDGTTTERRAFVAAGLPATAFVTDVEAGGYHALALTSAGTVYAWGRNTEGQLGDGTTADKHTPTQVPGLTDVAAIAAGFYHSLAIKTDGTVWAWGWNNEGQLGLGNRTTALTPTKITALPPAVATIDGGVNYTFATLSDGSVKSWGNNQYGQLGYSGTTKLSPTPLTALPSPVTRQAAGSFHALATPSTNAAYAWGSNNMGQLGNGDKVPENVHPTRQPFSSTPTAVAGAENASAVAAGATVSYALRNGTVWSWGENSSGQLGNGTTTLSDEPVPAGCPQDRVPAYALALVAEPPVAAPGAPVVLHAIANQEVGGTPYAIHIFDKATGVLLNSCATGVQCTATVTSATPAERSYSAYIGTSSLTAPPPNTKAAAETTVRWGPTGPGPYQSSCTAPTQVIANQTHAGKTLYLALQQNGPDEAWLCFRFTDNVVWIGGRVTVAAPSLTAPAVANDDQADACSTEPGNTAPGPRPLQQGELGSPATPYKADVYASSNEAWLCVRLGAAAHRVRLTTTAPPSLPINLD